MTHELKITSDHGYLILGSLYISWGNQLDDTLTGYAIFSLGNWGIEFGEIDNGNGIHLVNYNEDGLESSRTLLKL